ncbi:MAG: 6-bladed beta-propeller [Candidatus Delongbacteria bacterium]|nr:6-bladed beta-propeller [Candidatus Delongbacteria bacterium]MBN2834379.1 6-bladed beta-propeller [Candidatus Delongbacteria bacterium]
MKTSLTSAVMVVLIFFGCTGKHEFTEIKNNEGSLIALNNDIPYDVNYFPKIDSCFMIQNIWFYDSNVGPEHFFAIDSLGRIFVYNYKDNFIYNFDGKGTFLKKIGGNGYGPGELNNVNSIHIQNDKLRTFMIDQKKVNIYNLDGEFLHSKTIDNLMEKTPNWFDKGEFKIYEFSITPLGHDKYLRFFNGWNKYYYAEDISIITEDKTIKLDSRQKEFSMDKGALELLRNSINNQKLCIAENSKEKYKINIFDFDGRKLLEINKAYRKKKYPKAVKLAAKIANPNFDVSIIKYMQAIEDVKIDKYDRIWVKPFMNEFDPTSINVYDFFDKNGRYLNKIDIGVISNIKLETSIFFKDDKLMIIGKSNEKKESAIFVFDY